MTNTAEGREEFGFPTWFAIEAGIGMVGGTVNACDPSSWACTEAATELSMSMAATVARHGTVWVLVDVLVPGAARVIPLP